ncbi:MAG TPA: rRNA maturation RNase YbeY [Vicinamibacterales bacterium]|jgi:probable rRNA maturation factor|nr:rRNA maturation RNase YbeY [Vicinamibacterales bacterium]
MPEGDQCLHVLVADARGRPVAARGLAAWLGRVAPRRARGTVSVALVSDAHSRTLNRTYRRKNYATDVLSFPAGPPIFTRLSSRLASPRLTPGAPTPRSPPAAGCPAFLGDIVIARGVARRQARQARHSELTELKVLALHGLLHLLGYDHEHDNGLMRRVEQRLRRNGGLSAGVIERARR